MPRRTAPPNGGNFASKPRIDRLAFRRQHREHALVHPIQRFTLDKAVQCLFVTAQHDDGPRPHVLAWQPEEARGVISYPLL